MQLISASASNLQILQSNFKMTAKYKQEEEEIHQPVDLRSWQKKEVNLEFLAYQKSSQRNSLEFDLTNKY